MSVGRCVEPVSLSLPSSGWCRVAAVGGPMGGCFSAEFAALGTGSPSLGVGGRARRAPIGWQLTGFSPEPRMASEERDLGV